MMEGWDWTTYADLFACLVDIREETELLIRGNGRG